MIEARPEVLASPSPFHGGRNARAGADVGSLLDFSTCLNAFGPADVVRQAIREAAVDEYPDPSSRLARAAAADAWQQPVEEIAFGAGAAELIHAVCFAYLRPGDRVLVERPAFAEYERAARLCGAVIDDVAGTEEAMPDVGAIANAIRSARPRLAFVCSPSNPLGAGRPLDHLRIIADACTDAGTLLVLDQAYDAFADAPLGTPALASHPAVLHLRSLTKEHALAGVRVAFAVGPRAVISAIDAARVTWSASSAAQAAAVASFAHSATSHATTTIATLRGEAGRVRREIERLGYAAVPSSTHYFLIRVADAGAASTMLVDDSHILVRDCSSFGLGRHVRIAARTPADNDRLLDALDRLSSSLVR